MNASIMFFLLQVFVPEVTVVLKKLGISIGIFSKDTVEFFYGIIRQTMGMRKTEQDQVTFTL